MIRMDKSTGQKRVKNNKSEDLKTHNYFYVYKRLHFVICLYHSLNILISLTLKAPNKYCSRRHFNFITFYLSMKIRLDFSCESSAQQRIHLKHKVLFSLKNNEKNIYECRLLQS